jgi:DNA uptake protein ComE-like DNA-binding protein
MTLLSLMHSMPHRIGGLPQAGRAAVLGAALLSGAAWAAAPAAVPASGPATLPMMSPAPHGMAAKPKKPTAPPIRPIDINSASRKQLKTLPGIGDAEAARIISCRPYLTKADLVTKKVLPAGPFLSLKERVVAVQKSRPPAVAKAPANGCG